MTTTVPPSLPEQWRGAKVLWNTRWRLTPSLDPCPVCGNTGSRRFRRGYTTDTTGLLVYSCVHCQTYEIDEEKS